MEGPGLVARLFARRLLSRNRPPDRSLLGKVDKIRLRVRGTAKGHPVHLFLHTHFMTFHKVIGELRAKVNRRSLRTGRRAPAGNGSTARTTGRSTGRCGSAKSGWRPPGRRTAAIWNCLSVSIDGNCPADRRCVMVASTQAGEAERSSRPRSGVLSEVQLEGLLHWQFRDWDQRELGLGDRRVVAPPGPNR